jgi:hypothetical protein
MNAVLVDCSLSAEDVMLRERGRILSQLQAAMPRPTGNPNVHELTTQGETFSYVTEEEPGPLPASHGRRPARAARDAGAATAGPLPIRLPASLASGPAMAAYGSRFAVAETSGTLGNTGTGAGAVGRAASAGGREADEAQAALRRVLAAIDRTAVPENEFDDETEEKAAHSAGGPQAGAAGSGTAPGGSTRAQPGAGRGGLTPAARALTGALPSPAAARTVLPKPGVPGMSTSRELPKGAAAATLHALGEASHSGGPEFTAEGARRHTGGAAAAGPAGAASRPAAAATAGDAGVRAAAGAGTARRVAFAAQDQVHPIASSDPPAARINPRAEGFAATSGSPSLHAAAPAAPRGVRFGASGDEAEAEDAAISAAAASPAGYSAAGASYPASAGAASARAAAGGLSASADAVSVGRGGSSRSAGGGGGAFKGTVMERAPPVRIAMPGLQAGVSAPVTTATAAVPTAGGTRRSLFSASVAGAGAASREEPERAEGRAAASQPPQAAGGADNKPRSLFMRSMHSS